MGSITFESRERAIRISGAERFHAEYLVNKITSASLDISYNRELLQKALAADTYLKNSDIHMPSWERDFELSFFQGSTKLLLNGEPIDNFALALNTASALGSDAVKMLARIHAQCEIHGFVAGKNRKWMADIIENAPIDVFRTDANWNELVKLLSETTEGPVVMSYSVTDSFLGSASDAWMDNWYDEHGIIDEEDYDAQYQADDEWTALGKDRQWDHAIEWLYSCGDLEISPDEWPIAFNYGKLTAGELIEELKAEHPIRKIA